MARIFVLAMALQSFGLDFSIVTTLDQAFPDKWTHCPSGASPLLSHRDTVYAGLTCGILVFFKGYSRDSSGRADICFSYKIVKPDNTVLYDTSGIIGFSGIIPQITGSLLSRSIPLFSFTRKEKPGKYKIIVKAEDRIAKTRKTKEIAVFLSKYPKIASGYFNDVSFNVWIHSYCIDPDPGRACAAFSYFIDNKISNDNDIFWPVLYFFQCVFSEQPFLIDELIRNFPKFSQRLQEYTVFLLRAIQYEKPKSKFPIPDSLWKKFDKVAANGFFDPFTYAFKIKSNRFIEYAFYYYGRYSLIRFLIDCLGLNTPAGYDAFIKNCNEYGDECQRSLDKEIALQFYSFSRKILEKICSKHPLVNSYCNFAYENDRLETNAKKALKEIIDSAKK